MQCNDAGLQIIRDCEGLRLNAYRDAGGRMTIGYGHCGADVRPDSVIDETTAEVLLTQDVSAAEAAVGRLARVPLNGNQFSALVSFVFNIGEGKLRNSVSMDVLNKRLYLEFADRLLLWDKSPDATGNLVEVPGLKVRRARERALFLTPAVVADNGPVAV